MIFKKSDFIIDHENWKHSHYKMDDSSPEPKTRNIIISLDKYQGYEFTPLFLSSACMTVHEIFCNQMGYSDIKLMSDDFYNDVYDFTLGTISFVYVEVETTEMIYKRIQEYKKQTDKQKDNQLAKDAFINSSEFADIKRKLKRYGFEIKT